MSGTIDPWAAFESVQPQADQWAQFEQVRPTAGPSGNEALDWSRKLGTAATTALGATAGLPRGVSQAMDWLAGKPPENPGVMSTLQDPVGTALRTIQPQGGFSGAMGSIKAPATNDPLFPTIPQAIEGAYATTGATEYRPATWMGRRTLDALTAAPMAVANPASLPAMLMGGAAGGQAAETAQRYGAPESVQIASALLGGAAGAKAGSAIGNMGANAVGVATPLNRPVSATRAELAKVASEKYGIPVRGAMVEGRTSPARWVDSELNNVPLSGMRGSNESIQTAYNRAVAKTFGADAAELSTDVYAKARAGLVDDLNKITPNLGISGNAMNGLVNELGSIETAFARLKGQGQVAPVKSAIDEVLDAYATNNNRIPGDVYHSMVKKGSHLDRMRGSQDPDVRNAAGDIMRALEDAVENSMPANSKALADFREWRGKWRSMRMAEDATDASGNVSGAKLNQVADRGATEYKSGAGGDIAELGRIGSALFPDPPQSGTAARSMVWKGVGAPAAVAGAAGTALLHPELAGPIAATAGGLALGGAATGAATRAASAYLRSPQYLERAILAGTNPNAFRFQSPEMLARLLMAPAAVERANTPSLPQR